MSLSYILLALSVVVILSKLTDFLLGRAGRRRLKNALIFSSWYQLQKLSFETVATDAARRYETVAARLVGRSKEFGLLSPYLAWVAILIVCNYSLLYAVWRDQLVDPSGRIFPAPWIVPLLVYPLLFVLVDLGRQGAATIAARPKIRVAFGVVVGNGVIAVAFVIAIWYCSYVVAWWRLIPLPFTVAYEQVLLPTIAPPLFIAALTPALVFLLVGGYLLVLIATDCARRTASFVLERCDEGADSPVTIVASVVSAVVVILTSLAKLVFDAA